MHYEIVNGREHLLAVYDKHQILVSYLYIKYILKDTIECCRYTRPPGEQSHEKWIAEKQWKIEELGTEGIAWANHNAITYFFTCIDVKQGETNKIGVME